MTTSDAMWARGLNNAELRRAMHTLQSASDRGMLTDAQRGVLDAVRTEYTNRHDQGAI
jgi:hypothetical protein